MLWFALILTWVTLDQTAAAQLEGEVQKARQRHEPLAIADFAVAAVPSDQDAAPMLLRGCAAYRAILDLTDEDWRNAHQYPLTPDGVAALRRQVTGNAAALAEVRRARSCPNAAWHFLDGKTRSERERQSIELTLRLSELDKLAELTRDAALLAHADGNDAAAIQFARDVLAIARLVSQLPHAWGSRSASSMGRLSGDIAGEIAGTLNSAATTRAASRDDIAVLIAELLDERGKTDRLRRALLASRAEILEFGTFRTMQPGTEDGRYKALSLSTGHRFVQAISVPHNRLILAEHFAALTLAVEGAAQPDFPTATKRMSAVWVPPRPRPQPYAVSPLNANRYSLWDWMVQQDFFERTTRRTSAVVFALRLHQLDHAGRLPAQLAELRGTYLPDVPIDPMAIGGGALGYGHGGQTVFVYSVGEDGRDNVAMGWTPTAEQNNQWDRAGTDYVLFLDCKAAAPPAAPSVPIPANAQ